MNKRGIAWTILLGAVLAAIFVVVVFLAIKKAMGGA